MILHLANGLLAVSLRTNVLTKTSVFIVVPSITTLVILGFSLENSNPQRYGSGNAFTVPGSFAP